jgi:malate dehydrogenase (oxaloacetate-decarboxylating)
VLDSKGAICDLSDLSSPSKAEIRSLTNPRNACGTLVEVIAGADVFIGVSAPGLLTTEMVATMASKAIVFALANPVPEILPDAAKAGGAFIVATGRSDFPNQVNNVLAFPGVFKGAFETGATQITEAMKVASAEALANHITPTQDQILPEVFDKSVVPKVVAAIRALS